MSEPIGLRICNPANIRYNPATMWLGQRGFLKGFVVFIDMKHGVRAASRLLRNYITKTPSTEDWRDDST